MAFVWSQLELILASTTIVIHHQLNNMVCCGEYDKKHGKREGDGVREREEGYCQVSVKTRRNHRFLKYVKGNSKG